MTLGATLIETDKLNVFREYLAKICTKFNKETLHCKNLNHFQKVYLAKKIAKAPITIFGAISLKSTLGWYENEIQRNSKKYYNKCAQYLLECLGDWMQSNRYERHQLDIVFEEGNFEYEKLRNLIRKCQDTPKATSKLQMDRIKLLRFISADKISAVPKPEEPLLQMPDLVAHALYKCVDKPNSCYRLTEPRYFLEIRERFFHDPHTGNVIGKGLKAIHSINHLKLDEDIAELLRKNG